MILMKETIFFFVLKFWKISQKVVKRLFSLFREVTDFPPYLRFYFCGSSLKPSHDKTRGRCKIVNEVTCVSLWMDRETQVNLQSLCWRLSKSKQAELALTKYEGIEVAKTQGNYFQHIVSTQGHKKQRTTDIQVDSVKGDIHEQEI